MIKKEETAPLKLADNLQTPTRRKRKTTKIRKIKRNRRSRRLTNQRRMKKKLMSHL